MPATCPTCMRPTRRLSTGHDFCQTCNTATDQAGEVRHLSGGPIPARTRSGDIFMWCCLGLLFAPVGVIAAIVLFARERVGAGLAVLMCSALGALIALAVFSP